MKAEPTSITSAKDIASKVWNTASPAAIGACMIRLAIRPAKSLSNQPTGWRITWAWDRQRIIVPKFTRIVLCNSATCRLLTSGLINRIASPTRVISMPYPAQTCAAGWFDRKSTSRPTYQINATSLTAVISEVMPVTTKTLRNDRIYSARNGHSLRGGVSDCA